MSIDQGTTSAAEPLAPLDNPGTGITLTVDIPLSAGWNLISIPVRRTPPYTAQSALDEIAAQGGNCSEVDRWLNGGWDAHITGLPFNDFILEPGKGYFLKCTVALTWQVTGELIMAPVPLELASGWNLVALPYGPHADQAQAWLNDIIAQGGSATEVDRWLNGGWDAHINGLPFNDYPISKTKGYFIKMGNAINYVPEPPTQTVCGTISADTTWTSDRIWLLTCSTTVNAGVTLAIEPETTIKTQNPSHSLVVDGALNAQGEYQERISFTSYRDDAFGGDSNNDGNVTLPTSGGWAGISIENGASGTLTYTIVRFGGYYSRNAGIYSGLPGMLYADGGTLELTDSVVSNSGGGNLGGNGIHGVNGAELSVTNSVVSYGLNSGTHAGITVRDANVTLSGSTISNNSYGLSANLSSTVNATGSSFVGNEYGLYANGLTALTVSANSFADQDWGLWIYGTASPVITNNSFNGHTDFPARITFLDSIATSLADISGNSVSNNAINGLSIQGTIAHDTTLPALDGFPAYALDDSIQVNGGTTLTVEAGAVFKATDRESEITVLGALDVQGTAANPVIFTSISDGSVGEESGSSTRLPIPGDWAGISIENGASATLNHANLYYGGYYNNYYGTYTGLPGMLYADGGTLVLTDSVVSNSGGGSAAKNHGAVVGVNGANLAVSSSTISDNLQDGTYAGVLIVDSSMDITGSAISNNRYGLNVHNLTGGTIRYNSIVDNALFGLYGSTSGLTVAERNWWGSDSGPSPYGSGNGINYRTYTCGTPPVTCHDYNAYADADPWIGQDGWTNYSGQWPVVEQQQQIVYSNLPPEVAQRSDFAPASPPSPGTPYPQVHSRFGNFYLQGFGIINRYDVMVDWNGSDPGMGSPGRIDFNLNGSVQQASLIADGGYHEISVDNEMRGGENSLTVIAYNADGTPSEKISVTPYRLSQPSWMISLLEATGNLKITYDNDKITYATKLKFPDPPWKALAFPEETIPLVGGGWGLKETQVKVDLSATSKGNGKVQISGGTGVKMGNGNELGGALFGGARINFRDTIGLTEGTLGGRVEGKVTTGKQSLITLATGVPIPAPIAKAIYVEGILEPSVTLRGTWRTQDGDTALHFDTVNGDFVITIKGVIGAEIWKDLIEASLTLGGTADGGLGWRPATNEIFVDHLLLRLFLEGKIKALGFVNASVQKNWTWHIVGGGSQETMESQLVLWTNEGAVPARWKPIPRTYADAPYAVFLDTDLGEDTAVTAGEPITTSLISNLFTYPTPDLAARGDGTLLLSWTHENTSKPQLQGQEITASLWNGATWSDPMFVTNDTNLDLNPHGAFDGAGNGLLAWERVRTPNLPITSTLDFTVTSQIEIAVAVFSQATGTWSAPTYLTDNAIHDYAPRLVTGDDGSAMLTWVEDPGNDYFGTGTAETIRFVSWDGGVWSSPLPVVEGVIGILDYSLDYRNSADASLLLSYDLDGDPATATDAELFYTTWNGTSWAALQRLTNNAVPDLSPTLLHDSTGAATALWLQDDQIAIQQGGWGTTPVSIPIGTTDGQFVAYRAAINPTGNLVLLWQGTSETGTDLHYAVYDAAYTSWSQQSQLTDDDALEREMSIGLAPSGALVAAYARDQIVYEERVISPTLTITNVPTVAQTDLVLLRYTTGPDLATDEIALSDPNPSPGSSTVISATIHNRGDRVATPVEISIYDGAPGTGVLIGSQTLPVPLVAGITRTVTVNWSVPSDQTSHTLYVVADPANHLAEQVETNNVMTRTTVLPELYVENALSYYGAGRLAYPIAMVRNTGVLTASNIGIELRQDTITGTIVYAGQIPILAPGALDAVSTIVDLSAYADGIHALAVRVDPSNAVAEFDEANNDSVAALEVLPDLVVRAGDVTAAPTGSDTSVSATVRNLGMANAGPFVVTIFSGSVMTDTNPVLLTLTASGLVYDGMITLTGILPGQPANLYAIVDRERVIQEIDRANNGAWAVVP